MFSSYPILAVRFSDFLYFLRQIFFPHWKEREENPQEDEPGRFGLLLEAVGKKLRSNECVGTTVSILIHALIVLFLSWMLLPIPKKWGGIDILSLSELPAKVESDEFSVQPGKIDTSELEKPQEADPAPEPEQKEVAPAAPVETVSPATADPMPGEVAVVENGTEATRGQPDKRRGEFASGGGFEGRTKEGRGRSVGVGDISSSGENAVEAALVWIAAHQMPDGGWSFDFEDSCKKCSHGGTHGSRIAATALALLPFLGSGYTHQDGPYKKVVEDGLAFLVVRAAPVGDGRGGRALNQGLEGMYSHGIATIALCEAHALARVKQNGLRNAAQGALQFIENAQNRSDGGWRYNPNQPGDLSVTAWQVMALKSGKLAGLHVSQPAIYLVDGFLEAVSWDGGREYRYLPSLPDPWRRGTGPDSAKTSTASGLLLRMYLGWKPGEPMLDEGIAAIARWGPLKEIEIEIGQGKNKRTETETICNLYFAYYVTLALHHYDSSHWMRWNPQIREFLVQTQSTRGDEAGSWFFPDHYCDKGGRLLNTVLATLILETPYRIMPLFRRPGEVPRIDFPLE